MTVRLGLLAHGELDHELIWGWMVVCGAAAGALWLSMLGVPSVACPLRWATGIPCPTCGMTRAIAALAAGDLRASIGFHPFVAPAALAAAIYVPYALSVSSLGLRRIRLDLAPHDRLTGRAIAIASGMVVWAYLILAGR